MRHVWSQWGLHVRRGMHWRSVPPVFGQCQDVPAEWVSTWHLPGWLPSAALAASTIGATAVAPGASIRASSSAPSAKHTSVVAAPPTALAATTIGATAALALTTTPRR